jgi:hypothetical protein
MRFWLCLERRFASTFSARFGSIEAGSCDDGAVERLMPPDAELTYPGPSFASVAWPNTHHDPQQRRRAAGLAL